MKKIVGETGNDKMDSVLFGFSGDTNQQLRDLQLFVHNAPIGLQKCKYDPWFTIIKSNLTFLSLIGYTADELESILQNRYSNLIHPEDRNMVFEEINNQLLRGNETELEYRIICKDGSIKWILDKGNLVRDEKEGDFFCCTMTDITAQYYTREELRLSLERHQIIMNQSTDIIFEWDIDNDSLAYSANWQKKFGYDPIQEQITEKIPIYSHIHPDDACAFIKLMERSRGGAPYATEEFRIRNSQDQYIWCRIHASDQYDKEGRPVKAVGVITDIDKEKRMIEGLRRKAERDGLTGLYDKATASLLISNHLYACPPEEVCALLMIDIDNFKRLNDTKGHFYGDAVLSDLAAGMKREIRSSDLIGRVGGDEFAVFLKGIPSQTFAEEKARRLLTFVGRLFAKEKKLSQISCSIGIALSPADGQDFQQLYQNADAALYEAKRKGKNRYAIYHKRLSFQEGEPCGGFAESAADSASPIPDHRNPLFEYLFQVLYDAVEMDQALAVALEIIGRHYGVKRAYIYKKTENGAYENTVEWLHSGPCRSGGLQSVSLGGEEERLGRLESFYCKDPDNWMRFAGPDAGPFLCCLCRGRGRPWCLIGFEQEKARRLWSDEETASLHLLARLLHTFL